MAAAANTEQLLREACHKGDVVKLRELLAARSSSSASNANGSGSSRPALLQPRPVFAAAPQAPVAASALALLQSGGPAGKDGTPEGLRGRVEQLEAELAMLRERDTANVAAMASMKVQLRKKDERIAELQAAVAPVKPTAGSRHGRCCGAGFSCGCCRRLCSCPRLCRRIWYGAVAFCTLVILVAAGVLLRVYLVETQPVLDDLEPTTCHVQSPDHWQPVAAKWVPDFLVQRFAVSCVVDLTCDAGDDCTGDRVRTTFYDPSRFFRWNRNGLSCQSEVEAKDEAGSFPCSYLVGESKWVIATTEHGLPNAFMLTLIEASEAGLPVGLVLVCLVLDVMLLLCSRCHRSAAGAPTADVSTAPSGTRWCSAKRCGKRALYCLLLVLVAIAGLMVYVYMHLYASTTAFQGHLVEHQCTIMSDATKPAPLTFRIPGVSGNTAWLTSWTSKLPGLALDWTSVACIVDLQQVDADGGTSEKRRILTFYKPGTFFRPASPRMTCQEEVDHYRDKPDGFKCFNAPGDPGGWGFVAAPKKALSNTFQLVVIRAARTGFPFAVLVAVFCVVAVAVALALLAIAWRLLRCCCGCCGKLVAHLVESEVYAREPIASRAAYQALLPGRPGHEDRHYCGHRELLH